MKKVSARPPHLISPNHVAGKARAHPSLPRPAAQSRVAQPALAVDRFEPGPFIPRGVPPRTPLVLSARALAALTPSLSPIGERDLKTALEEANGLLNPQFKSLKSLSGLGALGGGPRITADAPDANNPADTDPDSLRFRAAQAQVEANARLEKAALAELTPAQAQQYQAVKEQLTTAGDPVAELALQKMLLSDELPGAPSLGGDPKQDLLTQLAAVADPKTPLAEGIDRGTFLADLVQEVATPSCINQEGKATCTVTAATILLARENPAEYVRLAAGLASPAGEVTMADGETVLVREAGTATEDGTLRTISQRLLAPALMELGNGSNTDYDNSIGGPGPGLWNGGLDTVLEAMFDRRFEYLAVGRPVAADVLAKLYDTMITQLLEGESVLVVVEYGTKVIVTASGEKKEVPSNHEILVTGTETIDGVEYVKFINPWGREERITKEAFLERLFGVAYDPAGQDPSGGRQVA